MLFEEAAAERLPLRKTYNLDFDPKGLANADLSSKSDKVL